MTDTMNAQKWEKKKKNKITLLRWWSAELDQWLVGMAIEEVDVNVTRKTNAPLLGV